MKTRNPCNRCLILSAGCGLLCLLVGLLAFESFLFGEKLLLFKDIGADSLNIYHPYLLLISRSLQEGALPTWSFLVGMGQDVSGQLSALVFNPVVWLGADRLAGLMAWQHLAKCLVAGLSFFAFLRLRGNAVIASITGGLLLAYSGYMALGACWLFHADEVVCFSLLLASAEWALGRGRWLMLPFAVALCAIHSVMTLYWAALFLLIYSIIRHIELERGGAREYFQRAIPAGLAATLGVGIGSVFFVPGLDYVFGSARVSDLASSGVTDNSFALKLLSSLYRVFSNDALGSAESFRGWGNYLESPAFYCGVLSLLMLPQAFSSAQPKARRVYASALALALTGTVSDTVRKVFWAFQSEYFRTYSLLVVLFLLTLSVQALSHFERKGQLNRPILLSTCGILLLILWIPSYLSPELVEPSIQTSCTVFLFLFTGVLAVGRTLRRHEMATALVLALCAAEAVHMTTKSVAHRWTMTRNESSWKAGYNDWTAEALQWLQKNHPGVYRIHKDYSSSPSSARGFNDAIVFGFMGTQSYSSFNQRGYVDFLIGSGAYRMTAGSGARWLTGTLGRPLLQAFCSERFLLTRQPELYEQTGLYLLRHRAGDIAILENMASQPLGRAHTRFIDFQDYLSLPREAREYALLTCAVVDARTVAGESGLLRVDAFSLLSEMEANFTKGLAQAASLPGVRWETFGKTFLKGTISTLHPSLLVFAIPYDTNWNARINNIEVPIKLAGLGLMAVDVPEGDLSFELTFQPWPLWHGLSISLASLALYGLLLLPRRKTDTQTMAVDLSRFAFQDGLNDHARVGRPLLYTLIAVLVFGVAIRLYPSAAFDRLGFDENLYRTYVTQLNHVGLGGFPGMVADYIEAQRKLPSAILPPTRFLYIYLGHLWSTATGINPLQSLHDVSCAFSIFTLGLACAFAWRLGGPKTALGVTALMAAAPTQIHMSQHALIDGFFAFWAVLALWMLWEALNSQPGSQRLTWSILLGTALALLVMTKENSFFVFVGLVGVAALAPWLGYGRWSWAMAVALGVGPALGLGVLVTLSGGPAAFIETYSLLVEKAYQLEYAIKTGDGPWYRYLVDLLVVSPLILLLAVGSAFRASKSERPALYLLTFLAGTYLIMCNIKYGMNLRYTNMWDMPLRFLAFSQLCWLSSRLPKHQTLALIGATFAVALYDLRLYVTFFVEHPLYELVTGGLLHALKILK